MQDKEFLQKVKKQHKITNEELADLFLWGGGTLKANVVLIKRILRGVEPIPAKIKKQIKEKYKIANNQVVEDKGYIKATEIEGVSCTSVYQYIRKKQINYIKTGEKYPKYLIPKKEVFKIKEMHHEKRAKKKKINNNKKLFKKRLNQLVIKKGKGQTEITKEMGVSEGSFSNWINGKTIPFLKNVDKICDYFKVGPEIFYKKELGKELHLPLEKAEITEIKAYKEQRKKQKKIKDSQIFADRLRQLVSSAGKTQSQTSKEIGVARPTISVWINGHGIPSKENIKKLCNYFKVKEDFFNQELTKLHEKKGGKKKTDSNRPKNRKLFRKRLRILNGKCMYSHRQVAKISGINKSTYSNYLGRANYIPKENNFKKLCNFFNVSESFFTKEKLEESDFEGININPESKKGVKPRRLQRKEERLKSKKSIWQKIKEKVVFWK